MDNNAEKDYLTTHDVLTFDRNNTLKGEGPMPLRVNVNGRFLILIKGVNREDFERIFQRAIAESDDTSQNLNGIAYIGFPDEVEWEVIPLEADREPTQPQE